MGIEIRVKKEMKGRVLGKVGMYIIWESRKGPISFVFKTNTRSVLTNPRVNCNYPKRSPADIFGSVPVSNNKNNTVGYGFVQ